VTSLSLFDRPCTPMTAAADGIKYAAGQAPLLPGDFDASATEDVIGRAQNRARQQQQPPHQHQQQQQQQQPQRQQQQERQPLQQQSESSEEYFRRAVENLILDTRVGNGMADDDEGDVFDRRQQQRHQLRGGSEHPPRPVVVGQSQQQQQQQQQPLLQFQQSLPNNNQVADYSSGLRDYSGNTNNFDYTNTPDVSIQQQHSPLQHPQQYQPQQGLNPNQILSVGQQSPPGLGRQQLRGQIEQLSPAQSQMPGLYVQGPHPQLQQQQNQFNFQGGEQQQGGTTYLNDLDKNAGGGWAVPQTITSPGGVDRYQETIDRMQQQPPQSQHDQPMYVQQIIPVAGNAIPDPLPGDVIIGQQAHQKELGRGQFHVPGGSFVAALDRDGNVVNDPNAPTPPPQNPIEGQTIQDQKDHKDGVTDADLLSDDPFHNDSRNFRQEAPVHLFTDKEKVLLEKIGENNNDNGDGGVNDAAKSVYLDDIADDDPRLWGAGR